MEKSLFIPLREEGLTTMRIRYDFKTDAVRLYAAKEWEPDHDFAGYNHTWWIDGIYTEDARFLNTKEVWAMFRSTARRNTWKRSWTCSAPASTSVSTSTTTTSMTSAT